MLKYQRLLAFVSGIAFSHFSSHLNLSKVDTNPLLQSQESSKLRKSSAQHFIADAADMVLDSVVNVKIVDSIKNASGNIMGSSASGIVIDSKGVILTNAHVLSGFPDGIVIFQVL